MDQGTLSIPLKWTEIKCPNSGARSSHTSVVYKNYIITYGGWDTGGLDDLIIFDILKQEWTKVEPSGAKLRPTYGHTMCITQNEQIIIFGGRDPVVHGQVTLLTITDIENKSVECENVEMQNNEQLFRCRHSAQIHNDKMYVFGGLDKQLNATNQLWQFDLNTFTWINCKTSGSIPKERTSHCSAIHKGKLFIFGGFVSTSGTRFDDFYMINLGLMKWQKIDTGTVHPPPMYGSSAIDKDGHIFLFGGYKENGECINDLYDYDINRNEWVLLPTEGELPSVREYQTLVSFQDSFIVWGGWSSREDLVSDIYSLKMGEVKPSKPIFRATKKICDLETLFLEKIFADVTFVVEGKEFPAHRAILAKSCKYFYNMFTSGMSESSTARIEINDVKASTFRSILQFIYCEKADFDEDSVLDLLVLSDKYFLLELRNRCETYLGENLTEDNFKQISKYADQLDCEDLLQTIAQFGKINSEACKLKDSCDKLPKSMSDEISKI